MKKITVLLLLLALVLPGCAAPAASQPGITQPQTQTAPQTTQSQEKDAWEWMKELAPDYDFTQEAKKWTYVAWKEPSPVGLELEAILQKFGTPIEARCSKDRLVIAFNAGVNDPLPVVYFSQNELGKMVVTKTENLYFQKSGLTREDFEAFQLNETTYMEVIKAVGVFHEIKIYGNHPRNVYYLEDGGSVELYHRNDADDTLESMTFYPPASQSSTNEK